VKVRRIDAPLPQSSRPTSTVLTPHDPESDVAPYGGRRRDEEVVFIRHSDMGSGGGETSTLQMWCDKMAGVVLQKEAYKDTAKAAVPDGERLLSVQFCKGSYRRASFFPVRRGNMARAKIRQNFRHLCDGRTWVG